MEKEPTKKELFDALEAAFGNAPVRLVRTAQEKETPPSESTPSTV